MRYVIGVFRTIGVRLRRARTPLCIPKPCFPYTCFRCNTGYAFDVRFHGACADRGFTRCLRSRRYSGRERARIIEI